ncbi:Lipoprotein LipO precursor [compost metagenome]
MDSSGIIGTQGGSCMKRSKKKFTLLLAATMLLSLLTACSSNGGNGAAATGSPSSNQSAAPAAADEGEAAKIEAIKKGTYTFETPVTITTVTATDSSFKYKNGETLSDNVHTRWAKEQLGIDIRHLWEVPGEQFATKMRLMLTAKQELPDVVTTMDIGLMNELIQSGAYKDITADFDKYASEQMKEIFSSHPLIWSQVTFDGKHMGLPYFANAGNDNAVMWVRQDWLDELKMQAPATFEELEAFMQALLDKKPGNSTDSIIPLGVSLGSGGGHPNPLAGWLGESTWIFGPFGTVPYQWNQDAEGKLVHGSTVPEMKKGLEVMRNWYEKGYISKEAGLHDENKLAELIGQGRVGVVVAPYWMGSWPVPDLQKNVPGATMKPYPIPTGNGKAGARDTTFLKGAMLVRDGFEHTDALFLYLNRLFAGVDKEKGNEFEHGWAEGYDYTVKPDGTISTAGDDIPGGSVGVYKYFLYEPKNPFSALQQSADNWKLLEQGTLTAAEQASLGNPDVLKAAQIVVDGWSKDTYWAPQFLGASTPAMQSKGGITTKLEGETVMGIIYGRKPLEDFDKFVKEWYSIGGEQMTKEANEWFDSTK